MNEIHNIERLFPYISFYETLASNQPFICNRHEAIQQ